MSRTAAEMDASLEDLQDAQELDLSATTTRAEEDGRVFIDFSRANFFHTKLRKRDKEGLKQQHDRQHSPEARVHHGLNKHFHCPQKQDFKRIPDNLQQVPRMNVAILITGSRGDVQPFIALGHELQKAPYHHRVRICTHPVFKDFVEENGLEFHSIGGDPAKLMAYMVKNPGILPSLASIKAGDIGSRKAELAEMLLGCWRGCTQAGDGITEIDLRHPSMDEDILLSYPRPFVADAIIANPPSYAHIHIAEKLAVPLHIMFTMPWSPTGEFPHPLANLDAGKVDARIANYLSYHRVELMTWEGLHDIINHFREKTLMLDAISPSWGYRLFTDLKVPFTYCWSEALIPKPADWGDNITISGFFFLSLASSYKPEAALQEFLDAGPPPVYIGFGSIVVDDPEALTKMIFEAVKKAGVRALVSKGWGNVGGTNPPDNVFLLGNVPHDWLFPRCSAVVHHGGAGTTAIGVALGKPTVIVPFFGDQPWWAGMIYRAGAGPEAVPFKRLTADKLAANIIRALEPDIKEKAHELSQKIKGENGPKNAAEAFHAMPQMENLACFLCPDRVGVWRIRRTNVQLSAIAAGVLVANGKIKPEHLKLVRHKHWHVEEGAGDPLVGLLGAFVEPIVGFSNDVGDLRRGLKHQPKKSDDLSSSGRSSDVSGKPSNISSRSSTESAHGQPTYEDGIYRSSIDDAPSTEHPTRKDHHVARATGGFAASMTTRTLKFPVTLMYNLANGFHNAPTHYLDDRTVRVRDNVTGINSGLLVGSKAFGLGMYDAVTGLVTQPYHGFRESKGQHAGKRILGVSKGVGQGLGGLVLKSTAGVLALPGYGLKGIEREIGRQWSGTEHITKEEVSFIKRAQQQARDAGLDPVDVRKHDARIFWEEAKGAGVGKRVVERRIWEGYSEMKQLRLDPERTARFEKDVLGRWETLNVTKFLAGLHL